MMTQILVCKKEEKETMTREDLIKQFNSTDDLEAVKGLVEKAQERFYVTWASVDARDKAGERIPIEDIIKNQDTLLERNGPITDSHTNAVVGQTHAYKVLLHPETKTLGVLQLNRIFSDNKKDDDVWEEIKSGERTGSSVGGIRDDVSITAEDNGQLTRVLHGFAQYETATCVDPCNPFALNEAFSVVAKSGDVHKKMDEQVNKEETVEETQVTESAEATENVETTEKVEESETTKEDGDDMEEAPEVSMADIMAMLKSLSDRLDEVEESLGGEPEEEKTEDESDEEAPEEEEKTEEEDEVIGKDANLAKENEDLKKEIEELRKAKTVTKTIDGNRPSMEAENSVAKTEDKKTLTALDVARGNATTEQVIAQYE